MDKENQPYLYETKHKGKARQHLVIPSDAPKKYRWWNGGQSILETLMEIGAWEETIEPYRPRDGMKKR